MERSAIRVRTNHRIVPPAAWHDSRMRFAPSGLRNSAARRLGIGRRL